MLDAIFSWNTVWWLMLVLYVPSCLGLIVIVLLQKGKGVGFSGAFGAGPGGADAVFGPRSSKSLPQKITYTMAGIFMTLSLLMSMLSGNLGNSQAPATVEDTGVTPVTKGGPGNSIDDLFNDTPATPAEAPAAAPAAPAEGTPAPAATPATEAPATATETPAPATEAPAAPAAETPAAPAADTPAPAAPVEAPAAPAAQ